MKIVEGQLLIIRRDVSFGRCDDICTVIDVRDAGVTSKVHLLTQQGCVTRYERTLLQLITYGFLDFIASET